MRIGDIVVARILARGQYPAQSMPFIHRPGHHQHIGRWTEPGRGLRSRVELKGRPVERFAERSVRVKQGKLSRAERRIGTVSLVQLTVELIHELAGGNVTRLPQGGDYLMGAGSEKSPR